MKKTFFAIEIIIVLLFFTGCVTTDFSDYGIKAENGIELSVWNDTIQLADSLKNTITSKFTDAARTGYYVSNLNSEFSFGLEATAHGVKSFSAKGGGAYFTDTLDRYVVFSDGEKRYSYDSVVDNRMNAYRIGYYYTDVHSSDCTIKYDGRAVYSEEVFHTYSDKIHLQCRFVSIDSVSGLSECGYELKIAKNTVDAMSFSDGVGEYTGIADAAERSLDYAAFDIDGVGIIGIIMTADNIYGNLTVSDDGDFYLIRQGISVSEIVKADPLNIACRLYNDTTHSFDGVKKALYEERNPLDISIFKASDNANAIGYNTINGAYETTVNGTDFSTAYYQQPDYHYKTNVEIIGAESERSIYFRAKTVHGSLENAVLIDSNENQLPISLEVSKNFAGEMEEAVYCPTDASYGEALFPLKIRAGENKKMTVLHLYQNWGNARLKQLSSIQFIIPYYHLSCGVTETNCIAPYYVFGKDGWTLPDFRAMSATLWTTQPQHYSYGRLYTVYGKLNEDTVPYSEYQKSKIVSSGPTYTDITTSYLSDGGYYKTDYRHVEFAQTDENRTYYDIDITVLKDFTVENARENFLIFSTDGRDARYTKFGWLDENNESQVANRRISDIKLGSECPYVSMFCTSTTTVTNFSIIVRDFSATVGGKEYTGEITASVKPSASTVRILLDSDTLEFKAGDKIHLSSILLPFGDANIANDDSVRYVREDSALYPLKLTATVGNAIEDNIVPTINVNEKNECVFALLGGRNISAVRVCGFNSADKITVYEKIDGEWVLYRTNTYSYDGYTVYSREDGLFDFAFNVDMGEECNNQKVFLVVQK